MKDYNYLLFDADNTIFDFDRSEWEALSLTFSSVGIELSREQHIAYHDINDSLWKKLEKGEVTRDRLKIMRFAQFIDLLGRDDLNAEDIAALYVEMLSRQSYLIDGVLEVCRDLSDFYPLYLITNGITAVQRRRFNASPVKVYFKDIFISEEMGVAKPSVEFFRKVSEAIGDNDPNHYLVIGDSLSSDIKGAANFGCDSVWIASEGSSSDLATYTVDGLSKIKCIISRQG